MQAGSGGGVDSQRFSVGLLKLAAQHLDLGFSAALVRRLPYQRVNRTWTVLLNLSDRACLSSLNIIPSEFPSIPIEQERRGDP